MAGRTSIATALRHHSRNPDRPIDLLHAIRHAITRLCRSPGPLPDLSDHRVGLGNLIQLLTLALQNALPPQDMGVSTAAAAFFRQIGGTLGVAVFLSILFARVAPAIADRLAVAAGDPGFRSAVTEAARGGDPVDAAFARGVFERDQGALGSVLGDSSIVQRLNRVLARPLADGFVDAMDTVFLVTSLVGLVTVVLVLFWREVPLRPDSGLAAARAGSGR